MAEAEVKDKEEKKAEDTKKETKGETKAEKSEKAEKKEKKPPEPKQVFPKSQKANPNANIDPRTGTRFAPGSARQLAFEIILKGAKEGKTIKEIREILQKTRKDNGSSYNMDIGYVNYVVAMHPEMLQVWDNGDATVIKVVKEPQIDKEAAEKFEADKKAKKDKAEKERAERKEKAAEAKAEKSEKKKDKAEKKEKETETSKKEEEKSEKKEKPDEKPKKEKE